MSPVESVEALVVGAGPAGLMAAEALAAAGLRTLVAEANPSAGRKLLMAGKSGLNLSKAEAAADFAAGYTAGGDWLATLLADFGPQTVAAWAEGLGIETFTGSSGRIFPVCMKASPLLRAWLRRLAETGVSVRTRWRWRRWEDDIAVFETAEGRRGMRPAGTVLALGGGSWARLGSDGAWVPALAAAGVPVATFRPSNVGFRVAWPAAMARHFGRPVKPLRLTADELSLRGEMVISARGVEGGGIYALAHRLRDGAPLVLDLLPDRSVADVAGRLARPRGKASLANHLRRTLALPAVKVALLRAAGAVPADPAALAARLKALPLPLDGPRPLDEAISTAGGIMRSGLTQTLMLRARPGVFAAGEMLDWDAPTGGYLLTACLATGRHAGRGAAEWIRATGR